jgi:hypothetical protein
LDEPFEGLSPTSTDRTGSSWDAGSAGDASAVPTTNRGAFGGDPFDRRPPRQRARRLPNSEGDMPPWGDTPGGNTPGNAPPDAGTAPPAGACQLLGTEQVVSGFDSSPAGVQARGAGNPTLSWTGAVGSPDLGALDFSDPSGAGGEVFYNGAIGDLRARVVSLNVQFASGANVRARIFAESGSSTRRRAVGAYTSPALAQWDCAQLDPSAPASAESGFDAGNIVGLGIEIEGSGSVRAYLDQIAY